MAARSDMWPGCRTASTASVLLVLLAAACGVPDLSSASCEGPGCAEPGMRVLNAEDLLQAIPPDVWQQRIAARVAELPKDTLRTWNVTWDTLRPGAVSLSIELPAEQNMPRSRRWPGGANMDPQHQLVNCWNARNPPSYSVRWRGAMQDRVEGSLRVLARFRSVQMAGQQPGTPPGLISIATTASVSRLNQLSAQCKSWNGPLSAAVYLPLYQRGAGTNLGPRNILVMRTAIEQVVAFLADVLATPNACRPDLVLAWELFRDDSTARMLFPVNSLRNLARLQVRTPLMAMLDVDLLVRRGLPQRLLRPGRSEELLRQTQQLGRVFILPAFDVNKTVERVAYAEALASSDKDILVHALRRRIVYQFDQPGWPQGHRLTNYLQWAAAAADYPVPHEHEAEPWFISSRLHIPWHDERYRGYGMNKVQHVEHVAAVGTQFMVLHDGWVLHRAHRVTDATMNYLRDKKGHRTGANLFSHTSEMFTAQVEAHKQGQEFTSQLHAATLHCLAVLPWWAGAEASLHPPTRPQAAGAQQQATAYGSNGGGGSGPAGELGQGGGIPAVSNTAAPGGEGGQLGAEGGRWLASQPPTTGDRQGSGGQDAQDAGAVQGAPVVPGWQDPAGAQADAQPVLHMGKPGEVAGEAAGPGGDAMPGGGAQEQPALLSAPLH